MHTPLLYELSDLLGPACEICPSVAEYRSSAFVSHVLFRKASRCINDESMSARVFRHHVYLSGRLDLLDHTAAMAYTLFLTSSYHRQSSCSYIASVLDEW